MLTTPANALSVVQNYQLETTHQEKTPSPIYVKGVMLTHLWIKDVTLLNQTAEDVDLESQVNQRNFVKYIHQRRNEQCLNLI
tara:strand:+ start:86 stop:331 length:246 start_codon:yes stop_codon:yes gene_type:complete